MTDKTRTTDDEAEDPRRDKVGGSGVYPADAENVPDDAEIRFPGQWTDYDESGTSEIIPDSAIGAGQGPEKESPKEGRPRKR